MTKKDFEDLADIEKLQKQWHKLSGLHTREEWSAAVVRAATAAEIAANYAVRAEFEAQSDLDSEFVDSLMIWANGLAGKLSKLLLPITASNKEKHKTISKLNDAATKINKKRNAIVHQGVFCGEDEATEIIELTREFINSLVKIYDQDFKLKERKS